MKRAWNDKDDDSSSSSDSDAEVDDNVAKPKKKTSQGFVFISFFWCKVILLWYLIWDKIINLSNYSLGFENVYLLGCIACGCS